MESSNQETNRFNWASMSAHKRIQQAKKWFRPFHFAEGKIRIAESSGKPHLYIKLKEGNELCITYKKTPEGPKYLLHLHPSGIKVGDTFWDTEATMAYISKECVYGTGL